MSRSRVVTCAGRGWWRRASGRPWSPQYDSADHAFYSLADSLGRVLEPPELRDRIATAAETAALYARA